MRRAREPEHRVQLRRVLRERARVREPAGALAGDLEKHGERVPEGTTLNALK